MASRGINRVTLIGHLGQDPEVRYMQNGNAVTTISLATGEAWKDKQTGELKEKTEWHRVVIFGKLAEIAGEYLHKGGQVYIEGKLQTRKWQDQSGQDRYTTEVVVAMGGTMQMLGARNDNGQGGQQAAPAPHQKPFAREPRTPPPPASQQQSAPPAYTEPPPEYDDDIPFDGVPHAAGTLKIGGIQKEKPATWRVSFSRAA